MLPLADTASNSCDGKVRNVRETRQDMRDTSLESMPSGGHEPCGRVADARPGPRDDLVRALVRGVGSRWRTRLGFHWPLRADRV